MAKQQVREQVQQKAAPIAQFGPYACGNGTYIKTAIWANEHEGQNGPFTSYSVTWSRSYRDKEGNWQQGNASIRLPEVPVLVFALNQAYAAAMNLSIKK